MYNSEKGEYSTIPRRKKKDQEVANFKKKLSLKSKGVGHPDLGLCVFRRSWQGTRTSRWADGAHVQPPDQAVLGQHWGVTRGAPSSYDALMMVSAALWGLKGATTVFKHLGSTSLPPPRPFPLPSFSLIRPACVIKTYPDIQAANLLPSQCNPSLLQLLAFSTQVCHATTSSLFSFVSNVCHGCCQNTVAANTPEAAKTTFIFRCIATLLNPAKSV